MSLPLRACAFFSPLLFAPTLSVMAQGQQADIYWSDGWNRIFHQFSDLDGDGTFQGAGEVSLHVDPAEPSSDRPRDLRVTEENGQLVSYWLYETADTINRGVDLNGDGVLSGSGEVSVFRDSGAQDGASIPRALDITDDGAVWWTSGLLISQPVNGLMRLEDLNGDNDASDPGEQAVMVDANGTHFVEHDLGSAAITAWSLQDIAAAGDGVIAYAGVDHALYRFEDFNDDGDVLDAGESILLLNASGERPDLPMNPDFADGTLKNLQTPAGYPTQFKYIATAVEDGARAFYFGTTGSPFNPSGMNLLGQGLNFIIFRGVDGNADGDVNDAGEVRVFFEGSETDGVPPLILLRGLDVLDGGTLYAVELKPFPALFPGEEGNAWIHRFQDSNGDGDASDPGEQQFGLFELALAGASPLFPIPPDFGSYMSDPMDFSVHRVAPDEPLVYCTAKTSSAGCSASIGTSDTSGPSSGDGDYFVQASQVQELKNGLLFAGLSGPTNFPFSGGTLCLNPPLKRGPILNSGGATPGGCNGTFSTLVNSGQVIPAGLDAGPGVTAWYQFWYRDPQNGAGSAGTALSNAVELNFF